MNRLLLMRHAHADDGPREDPNRGLTHRGRKDAKRMGKWLRKSDLRPDLIISSPYARAAETVTRALKGLHGEIAIKHTDALIPDASTPAAVAAIADLAGDADLVLVVSHNPLIENILLLLTQGEQFGGSYGLHWRHGSIAYVENGKLLWLVTPDIAREDDLSDETTRLVEHLLAANRFAATDLLIRRLRAAVGRRFRLQAANYLKHGSIAGIDNGRWRREFADLTQQAHSAGAQIAAGELGALTEAKRKLPAWLAGLNPWARQPQDVERQIDATTEDRIATAKSTWEKLGATVDDMRQKVSDLLKDWAKQTDDSRSAGIAVTEIASAFNDGASAAAREFRLNNPGVEVMKQWWAEPDACDICMDNVADGPLPEDLPFSSGHFDPPAHPNCRCSVTLTRSDSE